MLRFDLPPVWSHVTRAEAFINFLVCAASLVYSPWLMLILVVQGFVRGVLGHYKCPMHCVLARVFEARGWGGAKENPGAKMFANKLLLIASSVAVIMYAMGSSLWVVPCVVLLVFTTLEWVFSFCVACWAYGVWYSKFPPRTP